MTYLTLYSLFSIALLQHRIHIILLKCRLTVGLTYSLILLYVLSMDKFFYTSRLFFLFWQPLLFIQIFYFYFQFCFHPFFTLVQDYINAMKTTFLLKFWFLTSFFKLQVIKKKHLNWQLDLYVYMYPTHAVLQLDLI